MKIKEVCQQTGLTKKAVRYYEEEGLFCPERRTVNFREYREYTQKDVEELRRIACLRSLSLSIEELRRLREEPDAAPEIFQGRFQKLRAVSEDCSRQLRFYGRLDFDQRPFLDHVYQLLDEGREWEALGGWEEVAAPALLAIAPALLALLFPFLQGFLVVSWFDGPPFDPIPRFILFRLALGASLACLCFLAERLRRNRPARLTVWFWTALMAAVLAANLLLRWWGGYSYFLDYWSTENLAVVLGAYLCLSGWLWKGRKAA